MSKTVTFSEDTKFSKEESMEQFKKSFIRGYKEVHVYIYTTNNSLEMMEYIAKFQEILDKKRLGSQVVLESMNPCKRIGINNFYQVDSLSFWKGLLLSQDPCVCINLRQVPQLSPEELKDFIINNSEYSDECITITSD